MLRELIGEQRRRRHFDHHAHFDRLGAAQLRARVRRCACGGASVRRHRSPSAAGCAPRRAACTASRPRNWSSSRSGRTCARRMPRRPSAGFVFGRQRQIVDFLVRADIERADDRGAAAATHRRCPDSSADARRPSAPTARWMNSSSVRNRPTASAPFSTAVFASSSVAMFAATSIARPSRRRRGLLRRAAIRFAHARETLALECARVRRRARSAHVRGGPPMRPPPLACLRESRAAHRRRRRAPECRSAAR